MEMKEYSKTGASSPDGLVSYPGWSSRWGGSYPSADVQSANSTTPANRVNYNKKLPVYADMDKPLYVKQSIVDFMNQISIACKYSRPKYQFLLH